MSSSAAPKAHHDTKKRLVALVDATLSSHLSSSSSQSPSLALTKHPRHTIDEALYVQVPRSNASQDDADDATLLIGELQALPIDLGAFLLQPAGLVVSRNSALHVLTAVDPLFWVLPGGYDAQQPQSNEQWQPWTQLEAAWPALVRRALPADRRQLGHLYARMEVSESEVYYKFSPTKALRWLQAKVDRTRTVLLAQAAAELTADATPESTATTGTFFLGQQATTRDNQTDPAETLRRRRVQQEARAQADALQIVCQYLTEDWQAQLLTHLDLAATLLQAPVSSTRLAAAKRPHFDVDMAADDDMIMQKKTKKLIPAGQTVGLKKLAKVNTKGMAKMSAFFGVRKKENSRNKK
jgi:hypothetical protein